MVRSRRRLSPKQFTKRHPALELEVHQRDEITLVVAKRRTDPSHVVATRIGKDAERQIYEVSEACYKLASLEAMDRQGWADANTGQTGVPLETHHVKKRSKGRLDATENLAGVMAETHGFQHERKKK